METTLQQILKVQLAILAELRQLRQALAPAGEAPKAAPTPQAVPMTDPAPTVTPTLTAPTAPEPPLAAAPPEPELITPLSPPSPPPSSGSMLTPNELADLGGQFLDPGQMPRARVKPVDASDLSSSILDDIKAKNKAKRSAFAEFEKFGRDR